METNFGVQRGKSANMFTGPLDHRATTLCLAALFAIGCHAAPPPKAAVADDAAAKVERVDPGASFYEGEIGGMNEYAVDDKFKALSGRIQGCFENGSERVAALGGSFTVAFRVDRKGATRWAYMKSSTLGDRGTESCILEIVRRQSWPKPLSGEGLAEKTFDIEPSTAPHVLDSKRVAIQARIAQKKAAECRKGMRGAFLATAYLEPNGHVLSAGIAPPDEKGEAAIDCMVDEIQKVKFSGTGKLAKVTFEM
jgi:hypothetical protein